MTLEFESYRRKGVLFAVFAAALVSGTLACRIFETPARAYRRYMRCADRCYGAKAVEILKKGAFGCDKLPDEVRLDSQARRFYLEKAQAALPDEVAPPIGIGMTYWDEVRYSEAQKYFREALAKDPANLRALIALTSMCRLTRDYDEAERWARHIGTLKEGDPDKISSYLLGRILYERGRTAEARELLERALARSRESGTFLGPTGFTMVDAEFYLAQIAVRSGDPEGADAHFRAYVKANHDPDFVAYIQSVFSRGSQDLGPMYDEIEYAWVHVRQ